MIRKPVVLLAVVMAVLLFADPSFAGISGTAHNRTVSTRDGCNTCHMPHGSAGRRLWPASMTAQETNYGTVGALCYYCHGAGGGTGLLDAPQTHVMDVAGDAEFSHGRDMADLPSAGDALDTTLPYGGISSGSFECTTCHNVHDDTNQPFLQDDIDVLCARCHNDRQFVGGTASATQGNWGANYGSDNDGSHPVGNDVFEDGGVDSPITIAAVFRTAYGTTNGNHNLGGHLTDGGTTAASGNGVSCVTCHAVHGSRADADPPVINDGTPPVPNLLVIEQSLTGTIANGGSGLDDNNALCESCHDSPAGTIDASTGATYVAGGGTYDPNPGATNFSHPADDNGASTEAGVGSFPAGWPTGASAGTNVSPAPICESCHTPHPAANSARATITAASGTPILRMAESAICDACHTFPTGGGHHPSNVAMGSMDGDDIGNGDSTLTCSDCHGSGAHNWGAAGLDFDADWTPANNGRGASLAAEEALSAGMSTECEKCHYDLANVTPKLCPTNNDSNDGSVVDGAYQDIGEGTHYLGDATGGAAWFAGGYLGSGVFNAETTAWPAASGGADGWSRFDGTTGHVVCESCHELEPDKNVSGTKLLLQDYVEGGAIDPSGLCQGCHGTTPGGGSPHPMTGAMVAVTTGSAGHTLNTTTSGVIRSPIIGNATFPAVNEMNCDSCHQPHDADTQSGTYILDSDSATADVTAGGALVGDSGTPENLQPGVGTNLSYSPFCAACHDYF